MRYFSKIKVGEEVFSLVYGKGVVVYTLPKEHRLDGFHIFTVEFKKHKKIHYTVDGYPDWASTEGCCQTVFYKYDLELSDLDIKPLTKVLSKKQISRYRDEDILEMRCPSGIWRNIKECPQKLVDKGLKKAKYYLFRKRKA